MKLGFDIDGIVADLTKMMMEHVNKKFGLSLEVSVKHNIFDNKYVDDPVLNREIAMSMLEEVIENDDVLIDVEVYEDAVQAIRKLYRAGHTIHFITSRPAAQRIVTTQWLRKNNIPFNTLHVVGKSGPGGNLVDKGRTGRALNLDFFLDDSPYHLDGMYKYKNRWRKGVALFSRPWNEHELLDPSRFIRFNDWNEIIRHLGINKR